MKFVQAATKAMYLLHLSSLMGIMVNGSPIVSSSNLPMSLSSIISDLESKGVRQLSTATILSSRSVTSSDRSTLLQRMFGDTNEEESLDEATAFGRSISDGNAVGIAIANPYGSKSMSAVEAAATTVLSTHGSIIYICNPVDLQREEGLFMTLAPALERLLVQQQSSDTLSSELIVVFQGATDQSLNEAKAKFENAASAMLSMIAKPNRSTNNLEQIQDVFDTVEYLSEASITSTTSTLIEGEGQLMGPYDAISCVAAAAEEHFSLGRTAVAAIPSKLNTIDVLANRKLEPISRKALQSTLSRIREVTTTLEDEDDMESTSSTIHLVPKFGDLVDATISQSMNEYDEQIQSSNFFKTQPKSSSMIKRKRSELLEQMYIEIGDIYDLQLEELKTACFESFRKGLSKLRVSPTLPQDMQKVASDAVKQFSKQSKGLLPSTSKASQYVSDWSSTYNAKKQFQRHLTEYCTDRLNVARASGNYRPLPRKGVTVGMHWLLPKPFGNDYRRNPTDVYTGEQFVYSPPTNKIAEIGDDQVRDGEGHWKDSIVPVPGGSEMMHQFGKNE